MSESLLELPILPAERTAGPSATAGRSLLSALLEEQQALPEYRGPSAVERFSAVHDSAPAQARYYSALLPAAPPGPGQQYAFEVDLDRCSGCKACVTACHSLNGLDDRETWRDVGLLLGGTTANPLVQHVTTACHHCLDPACMNACPVDAYEKDPVTGIVKHLDDQCFGCQYCTLACPYDVPKYHTAKGIVRKCDMCSQRLAVGEAPACVQACPHEAIAIRVVSRDQVLEDSEAGQFLPGAPDPHLTHPTTHYKSARVFPRNTLPADYHQTAPQHPHWPLIVMLVLTQLSVGAFAVGQLASQLVPSRLTPLLPLHAGFALSLGLLALGASLFHLGRPQYAFRAFIGLRHSWLSREIVAFGIFAKLAVLYACLLWFQQALPDWLTTLVPTFGWGVVVTGWVGVLCSVLIYVVTHREFWSLENTLVRFVGSAAVLGLALSWLVLTVSALFRHPESQQLIQDYSGAMQVWLSAAALLKMGWELSLLRHLWSPHATTLKRSALLHTGPLANVLLARVMCGVLGGLILPWLAQGEVQGGTVGTVYHLCVAGLGVSLLCGELLERYLFFAGVAAPRMPGPVR